MNILFYGYGNHAKRIKKFLDGYIKGPKNYCFLNRNKEKLKELALYMSVIPRNWGYYKESLMLLLDSSSEIYDSFSFISKINT